MLEGYTPDYTKATDDETNVQGLLNPDESIYPLFELLHAPNLQIDKSDEKSLQNVQVLKASRCSNTRQPPKLGTIKQSAFNCESW